MSILKKELENLCSVEFEEGVLRMEFYDEASSKKASELLQKFRYIVYER